VRLRQIVFLAFLSLLIVACVHGQSPNATISGRVVDPSGAVIVDADILVANDATGVQYSAKTNGDGLYLVSSLPPGTYRLQVSKIGFKTLIKPDIVLNVQDAVGINFTLPLGAISEVVTVSGGVPLIDTEDAAVSTVVDRQFAENLPMNGRSFQTLIDLTPGVVLSPSSEGDEGQFSVNGQRTAANNWMVDGVSADVGIGANFNGGNGVAGTVGSFSVLGGTNSLVSVDAMQEFRIQTSTYAPEFGRTPGAQISISTRSGTNQFHGTAFDYFRNNDLDANNWFADKGDLPKPGEHQNDFGGTFGGPLIKDRTFFFFSYEGLRLLLPQTTFTDVPDLTTRQNAETVTAPFLSAYPKPNGPDDPSTGVAQFNATYSNPASLNAYSLRIDHKLSSKFSLFGRYDYSPSNANQRGDGDLSPLSDVEAVGITMQTGTAGLIWNLASFAVNDLRFNYSRTSASSSDTLDSFGGAAPITSVPLPGSFSPANASFIFNIFGLANPALTVGASTRNLQHQINLVDSLSLQTGAHAFKFGVDYRRLTPLFSPALYTQEPIYLDVSAASANNLLAADVFSARSSELQLQNLGVFAQDTWRVIPRLTLTYGLRWDVDFAPSSVNGPSLPAITGYDLTNLSNLALAPGGTAPFATTYGNFAPRLGVAYEVSQKPDWGLVFRGGFGVFYDLATSQIGDALGLDYPFGAHSLIFGSSLGGTATFPLSSADAVPPPITTTELSSEGATLTATDPNLQLPYTLEWTAALQQELGTEQSFSLSYVGSAGRRLIQSADIIGPNPSFFSADLIGNTASSSYNALQLQFERRLSNGLQALASYTWSHSIDDGSNGTFGVGSNAFVPGEAANSNRGPSDFDRRNVFSAGVTYDIPGPQVNAFVNTLGKGWALDNVIQAWSAPPVNVYYSAFLESLGAFAEVRPDVVPGVPLHLHGSQYPGGEAINPAAFTAPPLGSMNNPLGQGDLGRNALRGFGAAQWDFAVHRDFSLHESVKLQFRAELFNVLNHPNFAPPVGDLQSPTAINPQFGLSTQTLGQSLGGSVGSGGFSSLYQIGGPRSIQLALKLFF
jgi:outer membrane receptor protein involved in Fe transport